MRSASIQSKRGVRGGRQSESGARLVLRQLGVLVAVLVDVLVDVLLGSLGLGLRLLQTRRTRRVFSQEILHKDARMHECWTQCFFKALQSWNEL